MNLRDRLSSRLNEEEIKRLVMSYDVVGDIAITIVPPELYHHQYTIGNAILESNRRIKTVARRDGVYQGDFRTIRLKIIGGENRKETIHTEFGIRLCLNLEHVYFSVRSSSERRRIASLVTPGENVLVMFSGIAPYPLHIVRFAQAESVMGIEQNPAAHRFAEKNLTINKAADKIVLHLGDAGYICPRLGLFFDRIVMPLPTGAFQYLSVALDYLKSGGHIHFYTMQSQESIEDAVSVLSQKCQKAGRTLIHSRAVRCGHTSPNIYRYCIDGCIS
jgi:tRNA (guanine37-N1)-methyltransferase